jgi:hypothetical protein
LVDREYSLEVLLGEAIIVAFDCDAVWVNTETDVWFVASRKCAGVVVVVDVLEKLADEPGTAVI